MFDVWQKQSRNINSVPVIRKRYVHTKHAYTQFFLAYVSIHKNNDKNLFF